MKVYIVFHWTSSYDNHDQLVAVFRHKDAADDFAARHKQSEGGETWVIDEHVLDRSVVIGNA